jgi:hypothetical protein
MPPLALHEVALAELQDREAVLPVCTELGVATKVETLAAGAEAEVTVTLSDCGALAPPGPEQTNE